MNEIRQDQEKVCLKDIDANLDLEFELSEVIGDIVESCEDADCFTHVEYHPIPSLSVTVEIVNRLKEIVFPGYFNKEKLNPVNMKYSIGKLTSLVFDMLSEQISQSIRHDCFRYDVPCGDCRDRSAELALAFMKSIPEIRKKLGGDVRAFYAGDPAAKSYDEIIFSYPGVSAITVYRLAHRLFELDVPILPRAMSEYAHGVTGIDIHPGAEIGENFVIDHGTGVVIGETTVIGDNVRIYQGVTLGALSLTREAGKKLKGKKRHPTIEDGVIIYSGATILGGHTVIGANTIVGGNVWLTQSTPSDTKVVVETPKLIFN